MKSLVLAASVLVFSSQVSCDWSGSGTIQCYGQVACRPKEWDGSNGVGPEAMFFTPDSGAEFEIWAWDYHAPNIPWAECSGNIWYNDNDMGGGWCVPHKRGYAGCGYAECTGSITCHGC